MKSWRNGLRPLKEVKTSSQTSFKGKKRVGANSCQKATTRRSCHDSSHTFWSQHWSLETERRLVPNISTTRCQLTKDSSPLISRVFAMRSTGYFAANFYSSSYFILSFSFYQFFSRSFRDNPKNYFWFFKLLLQNFVVTLILLAIYIIVLRN